MTIKQDLLKKTIQGFKNLSYFYIIIIFKKSLKGKDRTQIHKNAGWPSKIYDHECSSVRNTLQGRVPSNTSPVSTTKLDSIV